MMIAYALTTIDNPYDPIEQLDKWYVWDMVKGHNSCAYLDRIAHTSDAMSEEEQTAEINRAIDEIIDINPFGIYKKVPIND